MNDKKICWAVRCYDTIKKNCGDIDGSGSGAGTMVVVEVTVVAKAEVMVGLG